MGLRSIFGGKKRLPLDAKRKKKCRNRPESQKKGVWVFKNPIATTRSKRREKRWRAEAQGHLYPKERIVLEEEKKRKALFIVEVDLLWKVAFRCGRTS